MPKPRYAQISAGETPYVNIYIDTHRKIFAADRLEKLSSKILGMVVNGKVARKRKLPVKALRKRVLPNPWAQDIIAL